MTTPISSLGELRRALANEWASLPDETPILRPTVDDLFSYTAVGEAAIVVAVPGQDARIWYAADDERGNGMTAQQAIFLT